MTPPPSPAGTPARRPSGADSIDRRRPTPVPDPYLVAWNPAMATDLGLPGGIRDLVACRVGRQPLPEGVGPPPPAMPVISSAPGSPNWAMAGRSPWATSRSATVSARRSSSRERDDPLVAGWATAGRCSARRSASTSPRPRWQGLGIPTTRALAIVGSDLPVLRERLETAAVLTRVAPTHGRFGTVRVLAWRGGWHDERALLADWVIERYIPTLLRLPAEERYAAWYGEIVARTARLMAMWTTVGFQHGVMNTDNFSILGPDDRLRPVRLHGRLSTRPGSATTPTTADATRSTSSPASGCGTARGWARRSTPWSPRAPRAAALEGYRTIYGETMVDRMRDEARARHGWRRRCGPDHRLGSNCMQGAGADYHRSFRALSRWDAEAPSSRDALGRRRSTRVRRLEALADRPIRIRLGAESRPTASAPAAMLAVNPKYVLRNWVAQEAIQNAETRNHARGRRDPPVARCAVRRASGWERYAEGPPAWAREIAVSCSS